MEFRTAGTFNLKRFEIRSMTADRSRNAGDPRRGTFATGAGTAQSFDMRNFVHAFSIEESMLKGSIRGTAVIYDAAGIFYDMPLTGQEELEIEYTDTKDVPYSDTFVIYAITNVEPAKNGADDFISYKIHFVSMGKFWSDRYDIKRCIASGAGTGRGAVTIGEQSQVVFDDYYRSQGRGTRKEFLHHDTQGEQMLVIPNMKPEETMHMFSRKAYSSSFQGSMFRFFENRVGFYFVNTEEWIAFTLPSLGQQYPPQTFFYNSGPPDNTPEAELKKLQNIIKVEIGESVNTIDAMNSGAFYRKFIELDILNRTKIDDRFRYEYLNSYPGYYYPDGEGSNIRPTHSNDFVNEHLNKWHETLGIRDYNEGGGSGGGLRADPYYGEVFTNKKALAFHLDQSKFNIRIFGTNEVFAGSLVEIKDLPKFVPPRDDNIDEERSGMYLVESVMNEYYETKYIQTLTLIKGGFRRV